MIVHDRSNFLSVVYIPSILPVALSTPQFATQGLQVVSKSFGSIFLRLGVATPKVPAELKICFSNQIGESTIDFPTHLVRVDQLEYLDGEGVFTGHRGYEDCVPTIRENSWRFSLARIRLGRTCIAILCPKSSSLFIYRTRWTCVIPSVSACTEKT